VSVTVATNGPFSSSKMRHERVWSNGGGVMLTGDTEELKGSLS
jgi:hypothetical protein